MVLFCRSDVFLSEIYSISSGYEICVYFVVLCNTCVFETKCVFLLAKIKIE